MPFELDTIDRRILMVLQRDGRTQNTDLAREVGLSPSPCLRRVRILEEAGVISRYVAVVDPAKVGVGQTFFIRIWLQAQDEKTVQRFADAMAGLPQVVECYLMLGDCDALVRVVARDIEDYRRFQSKHLTRDIGILNMKTDVPTQTVKQSYALPL